MAFDRKTSMYPNNGASGSSEDLEAYGVWVKSEPQDLTEGLDDVSGFPGASNFAGVSDFAGISSFPDASDFSTGFDDIGMPRSDFSGLESNDFGLGDFGFDTFNDGSDLDSSDPEYGVFNEPADVFNEPADVSNEPADVSNEPPGVFNRPDGAIERGVQGEMSTQLLIKIADELTSIRTELSDLKNEFSGNRAVNGDAEGGNDGTADKSPGGFFSGDDDKIALTGDEMENILSSADLSSEESLPFDPLREEDEAALKRLSEQNEAESSEEATVSQEAAPLEEAASSEEAMASEEAAPSEKAAPLEEAASSEEAAPLEEIDIDFDDLGINIETEEDGPQSIDEDLEAISLDDGIQLDDDDGLQNLRLEGVAPTEDDPFALADAGLDDISLNGNNADISLDDTDLSLNLDDLSIDTQTTDGASTLDEKIALDDATALDTLSLDDATALDETSSLDDAMALDETLSLDDALSLDDELSLDDATVLDETSSLDDALSLDDISSLDDMLSLEPLHGSETEEGSLPEKEMFSKEDEVSKETELSNENGGKEPVLDDSLDMDDLADDLATDDITMDELTTDDSGAVEDSLPKVIPEGFEKGTVADANNPFDDDLEAFTDDEVALDDDTLDDEPLDDADKGKPTSAVKAEKVNGKENGLSDEMKEEVKKVLLYTDQLLQDLPEEKIAEFANSEHFETYKKLFTELGLV